VTTPDLSAVEQLPMPDVRGWLALRNLPNSVQLAEDATADADRDRCMRPRGRGRHRVGTFDRPATDTERLLLEWLGHTLPTELTTTVRFVTTAVRNRRWIQLEES
jgi:hypothetical protein